MPGPLAPPAIAPWGGTTMKPRLLPLLLMLSPLTVRAQETSRVIPLKMATTLPGGSTQDVTVQLWDVPTGGAAPLFFEAQSQLPVGDDGNINFVFGSQTPGGLDPSEFPSGSSRFLDVVNSNGNSVLPNGRLSLTATAFALSPGPAGPPRPQGPQG